MSYITQKQLDAALLPIKTDVTALKSSVTALQNPVVTAPPPPSTGTTGSTGTGSATGTTPSPVIIVPTGAGSPMVDEDFTSVKDLAAFVAKYPNSSNTGQFSFDTSMGGKVLQFNFKKGTTVAPHWQIDLPALTDDVLMHLGVVWMPGFHIQMTDPATGKPYQTGTGYKDFAFGFSGADRRSGVDFSNGTGGYNNGQGGDALEDVSIDITVLNTSTPYSSNFGGSALVQHAANVGTKWRDSLMYETAYRLRAVDSKTMGARLWEKAPGGVWQTKNQYGYLPASGELLYPITLANVTSPNVNRLLVGENVNQPCDMDMWRRVVFCRIYNLRNTPGALAALGLVTS